jgi:hypothetical protein
MQKVTSTLIKSPNPFSAGERWRKRDPNTM